MISPRHSLQKPEIPGGIEDRLAMEQKAARVDLYAAQHFDTVALAAHRNSRRLAATSPGLGQGRVLPEAGFVFKDQGRALSASGFDTWIDVLPPVLLFARAVSNQYPLRPLHGEAERVQQ